MTAVLEIFARHTSDPRYRELYQTARVVGKTLRPDDLASTLDAAKQCLKTALAQDDPGRAFDWMAVRNGFRASKRRQN